MRPMNTGSGKTAKVADLKRGGVPRLHVDQRGSGRAAKNAKGQGDDGVSHVLTNGRKGSGRNARAAD